MTGSGGPAGPVGPLGTPGTETESAIRADRAWGGFVHALARRGPKHVIGIRNAGRGYRHLQRKASR